ncbi:hypothetical protein [Spiroplasma endosymbiont of Polydrusus pterygomalis]|uniref:hypothetical protein n=1 Tax=Spiroplasma endosymbiont of Polydrusus pterygomalis TaxID=3139327 RepID=UPI003CCA8B05
MPVWLTWIFSILILLGIFAWIGLSIYQKVRQIQGKKKEKKNLKKRRIENNEFINWNSYKNRIWWWNEFHLNWFR